MSGKGKMKVLCLILLLAAPFWCLAQDHKIRFQFYDEGKKIPNKKIKVIFFVCDKKIFPVVDDEGIFAVESDCPEVGVVFCYKRDTIYFGEIYKEQLSDKEWIVSKDRKPFREETPKDYDNCKLKYYFHFKPYEGLETGIIMGKKCK